MTVGPGMRVSFLLPRRNRVAAGSAVLCVAVGLGACDITRPPGVAGCQSYVDPLSFAFAVSQDGPAGGVFGESLALTSQMTFASALQETLDAAQVRDGRRLNMLVLSGGGQWGAFGAGFLKGWSRADSLGTSRVRRGQVDIVTGISTGAIMSSYAFLGSRWDEELSEVYLGSGPEGSDGIRADPVSDEVLFERHGLLTTFLSNAATDPSDGLERRVRQAVGELAGDIAAAGDSRQLFVGAVNLNDGDFRVFSLKILADAIARAQAENRPEESARLQDCYAEMLLASAAIPYLFPPRFIDNQAYVDGGARFGAFIRSVDLLAARRSPAAPITEGNLFVIVNGDLQVGGVAEVENSTLGIALRSVRTIVDQINKDSIFRIEKEAVGSGSIPWQTYYVYVTDSSCRDRNPGGDAQEFDPHFMKCLYDYGLRLGEEQAWLSFRDVPHLLQ